MSCRSMESPKAKSVMKKIDGSVKKHRHRATRGVTWDESNLSENEKIKKELNPTKIDEPKTPYWSPLETTDEDLELGVSPLSLSESYMQDQVMKSMWEHGNGSPPPSIRENGQGTSSSCGSRKSLDRYYGDGVPEDDNEDTVQKRQRFLEARKMHYKISKELLSKKPDELDEAEEDYE